MTCYHPIKGWRAPGGQIVFARRHGWSDREVTVPCGQCSGCRLEYSRQWAMRIMHESTLYLDNSFLTLTYSDENLPGDESLALEDHKNFMKRLRKRLSKERRKVRYYMCGEYGDTTHRPHYHYCLFNWDPPDKKFLKRTETDHALYTSAILDETWGLGDCYVGNLTFESAAYCGRYVMKKLTGERKSEYGSKLPEFSNQSRRPGIGFPWLLKWEKDVFPHDYCIMNGKKVRVPKYYDALMERKETPLGKWDLDETGFPIWYPAVKLDSVDLRKGARKRSALKHQDDQTPERLAVRETVHKARMSRLTRT